MPGKLDVASKESYIEENAGQILVLFHFKISNRPYGIGKQYHIALIKLHTAVY